jgi:2-oxoglutaroyl-CoA hydrolase
VERLPEEKMAKIVFCRPEKLNIITVPERRMLRDAIEALDRDPQVRVLVLEGEGGRAFSSGGDIVEFLEHTPYEMSEFADPIAAPERFAGPVIAAVDGYAMGVGLELALCCDFILATKRSAFAFPEIRLGAIPGSGGTQRVLRLLGIVRAKDFLMRGRRMSAEEAERVGLITRAVEVDALGQEVTALARELAAAAPVALQVLKRVLNKGLDCSLPAALELEGRAFGLLVSTQDWQEGVQAWREKRPPRFQGK